HCARDQQGNIAFDRAQRKDRENAKFRDQVVKLLLHNEIALVSEYGPHFTKKINFTVSDSQSCWLTVKQAVTKIAVAWAFTLELLRMADPVGTRAKRVGIEVSGSILRSVCIDGKDAIASTFSASVEASEARGSQIVNFINRLKAEFGDFDRVGICFPGLVDRAARRVAFSAQIPEHAET